jgi:hypothetical protein
LSFCVWRLARRFIGPSDGRTTQANPNDKRSSSKHGASTMLEPCSGVNENVARHQVCGQFVELRSTNLLWILVANVKHSNLNPTNFTPNQKLCTPTLASCPPRVHSRMHRASQTDSPVHACVVPSSAFCKPRQHACRNSFTIACLFEHPCTPAVHFL